VLWQRPTFPTPAADDPRFAGAVRKVNMETGTEEGGQRNLVHVMNYTNCRHVSQFVALETVERHDVAV